MEPNLFPQVHTIISNDLRQKILRALDYLNLDNIDIGLFLLSKEFEATLKAALETGFSNGKLQFPPRTSLSKMKLTDMIGCAIKNQIVSDSAILNYLRQERNERAHGSMPKLSEREVLMKYSSLLAGLYIDYMKLLDEYTIQTLIDAGEISPQVLTDPYSKLISSKYSDAIKRVGLFVDYENIMSNIQEMRAQDVGISLARYASQFGIIVCRWICADPHILKNPAEIKLGLEQVGFNVQFPKQDLQNMLHGSITDFMLIERMTDEATHSQPQIYIIVTGDADYLERVLTLLDSGHTVRILSFQNMLSLRYKRLQEQRKKLRQSLGYPDSDFFIDDLGDLLSGASNVSAPEAKEATPVKRSKATILFVDDEPNSISHHIRYFEKHGYSTEIAFDGRHALTRVEEHQPDLIVLDLAMPGMEGFEVVRRLRMKGNKVPIIVLTSHPDPDYMDEAYETGVDDFVYKNCRSSVLLARARSRLTNNLK